MELPSKDRFDLQDHLKIELPGNIQKLLDTLGETEGQVRIGLATDMSSEGVYGEQWLLVDLLFLRIITSENGSATQRFSIPLDKIEDAQIEQCVGNGLLNVTVDGKPQELLHFSNELTERFALVATYLRQRKVSDIVPDFSSDGKRCLSCGRRLLDPSMKVCPSCIKRDQVLNRLLQLARPFWGIGLVQMLLMLVGLGVDLLPPYLTKTLIDQVLTTNTHRDWLVWLVGGLLGLQIIRVGITIGTNLLTNRISTQFTTGVREKMFQHLGELSLDFFDRNDIGRLLTRINQDTEELQGLINQMANFILYIMLIIGIGIVLFSMDPILGLCVLIPAPFVFVATFFYQRYMMPYWRRFWNSRWRLNSMLNTYLSGIQVVKAFAQESQEEERYHDRNHKVLESRLRVDQAWGKFFPIISFAFGAGGLIIWYAGGNAVLNNRITLGTLMAFLAYLGMFYGPLSALAQLSQAWNRFTTIAQRTFEFLDETPKVLESSQPLVRPEIDGRIEFDHVTFGYDPYFPVLKDVSFTIEPGEMVGIVGSSGAGKTTLVAMISRFYDTNQGAIRIDDVDVRDVPMEELRKNIGVVLQTPFLFRGTLAQNIAYAKPDAPLDEIIRAAKAANAHDFIINMPEGYDTIVGEGGAGLSGGERQRISIARAILLNPKILILDEATSSVDTETERQIQQALEVLVKGRTTIAIAHRLSTLYNANRIIALERGRVVEIGTPEELVKQKGVFYKLIQMQTQFARLDGVVSL
jgi:ATP-binding cassette, subfamily B, bacterial